MAQGVFSGFRKDLGVLLHGADEGSVGCRVFRDLRGQFGARLPVVLLEARDPLGFIHSEAFFNDVQGAVDTCGKATGSDDLAVVGISLIANDVEFGELAGEAREVTPGRGDVEAI